MSQSKDVVQVGILGLGRSGWDIHALTFEKMPQQYRVAWAVDPAAARRDEAVSRFGCRVSDDYRAVLADPDVDLIVVATPSNQHADQTCDALRAGKHVVCEKPMATSVAEADRMIEAARDSGKSLTVFQIMRYAPAFMRLREVIDSGLLGDIVQIRLTQHRFSRRWDWQTLKEFGGGSINNAGAHFTDLAMQLFGPAEPNVSGQVRRTITSGDAEDHVKVLLTAPGAPTIDLEITAVCPYPQDLWLVMGTAGGLRGSMNELHWKWVDWSTLPPRPVDRTPTAADRVYPHEKLPFQEASWKLESTEERANYRHYYTDLYDTLRNGKPMFVTAESVRRVIATLDKIRSLAQ